MPKKPVKIVARASSREVLTEEQVEDLIGGRDLLSGLEPVFRDEAERRKCFKKHEAELLRRYTEKHPGRRPPIYWEVSAPGPKKKIGECSTPFPLGPHKEKWRLSEVFETEFAYLKRLGLLLPGEEAQAQRDEATRDGIERQRVLLEAHAERSKTLPASAFVTHSFFARG